MESTAVTTESASSAHLIGKLTWWVWIFPAVMVAALIRHSLYWLDFSHVMAGALWTGTDIFMGFILGPILRHLAPDQRRAVISWLIPKTILYVPLLALTTGIAGWFLASWQHMLAPYSPYRPWVFLACSVIALLTIQGFGILLPNSIRAYGELQKSSPDMDKVFRLNRRNNRLAGFQGVLQVAIILVMAHLTVG
ncbi:MAG: hypothetical protein M1493_05550 [Firmicutes bacterium]|jgi:hypothetical protein|uniref:DUF4149 domain-containing protein n=1 Tax=Sulfobacillus benefaciens TaxID=453960 RepID=A0A2T2WT44_9FIRM|nr:hypothetical protein [Bacillota bacterium]PSR25411.1 MAG: hypothetical protein C7B43_16925 [Sulfobacillus benefaciens]